jgi:hypothetical protein
MERYRSNRTCGQALKKAGRKPIARLLPTQILFKILLIINGYTFRFYSRVSKESSLGVSNIELGDQNCHPKLSFSN